MSFSISKPVVGQLLPLSGANWPSKKVSATVLMVKNSGLPLTSSQLNAKEDKLQLKQSLTGAVSRREMVSLAGLSLAGISLLLAQPAEARMSKAEMKNTLLEKLRELREKFGLSKPEDGSGENIFSTQKDIEVEEKKSTSQQENKIEDKTSTSKQENEGGETKSTPQQKSEVDDTSTPKPRNESGDNPTPQPEKETKREGEEDGEKISTPQQKDESPLLPFLNLTEIEGEPLVEATLGH